MPTTSGPNYVEQLPKPNWGPVSDPHKINALGQPMVSSGVDLIRAEHVNGLRLIVDLIYNHTHEYTDSVGSC